MGGGLIECVRRGHNTLENTRLVIDLAHDGRHRLLTVANPPRIVLDVYGDGISREAVEKPGRLPAELRRVHTVVVDPGHGGKDHAARPVARARALPAAVGARGQAAVRAARLAGAVAGALRRTATATENE